MSALMQSQTVPPTTDYASIPPRPVANPNICGIAAEQTADCLIKNCGMEPNDRDGIVADLIKHCSRSRDGYEHARELENRVHWSCDMSIAGELDNHSSRVDAAVEIAERDWAKVHNVQPALPNGTRVVLGGGEFGEITGVSEYSVASYLVKVDGDPCANPPTNSRRVIRFEDARMQGALA